MIIERQHGRGDLPRRPPVTLACTADAVWFWPGIALTERRGGRIRARNRDFISSVVTKLHGPAAVHGDMLEAVERAAVHLSQGRATEAGRALGRAALPPITADGRLLMAAVAEAAGFVAPRPPEGLAQRLWTQADITRFATLHLARASLSQTTAILFGLRPILGLRTVAPSDARLVAIETWRASPMAKAGFNPSEPRDWHGRWTADGGIRPVEMAVPLAYRPEETPRRSGRSVLLLIAAEEEDNPRRGLFEDFTDPLAGLRAVLYRLELAQLRQLDPANPEFESLTSPDWIPSPRDLARVSQEITVARIRIAIEEGRIESPEGVWRSGWATRGIEIEMARGGDLPRGYPTIDRFLSGIAISTKSMDLNAITYADPVRVEAQADAYVDKLAAFNGADWGGTRIAREQISGRLLDLVIPRGSQTPEQHEAIARAALRAQRLGIYIMVTEY